MSRYFLITVFAMLFMNIPMVSYAKDPVCNSIQSCKPLAEEGSSDAQMILGWLFTHGEEPDQKKAVYWYEKAAAQGDKYAQHNLANIYLRQKNHNKALEYYKMAAEQGMPEAQYELGVMYVLGEGVEINPKRARELFELSAKNGNRHAKKALEKLNNESAGAPSKTQIAYDEKRIADVMTISSFVEEYYQKTGSYPLQSEPKPDLVVSVISKSVPKEIKSSAAYKTLEEELEQVLGREINLPFDPEDGENWRFYQYATDGQVYYVSAFLYHAKPFAKQQGAYHNKMEISSVPCPECFQYKRDHIQRFIKFGPDDKSLQNQFFDALAKKNYSDAKRLLDKGANPSPACRAHQRCQPLASASEEGDLKLIEFLINNGADIDGYNAYDDVALIYALSSGQKEAAKLLVNLDANVNLPNSFGMTPFIGVCMSGDVELAKLMINKGANLDKNYLVRVSSAKKGDKSPRPLEAALKSKSSKMVSLLLEAGANPELPSSKGQTILELGLNDHNDEIKRAFTELSP
jgi:hypothetical protein